MELSSRKSPQRRGGCSRTFADTLRGYGSRNGCYKGRMRIKWWVSFLVSFPLLAQYAGPNSPSLTVEKKFKYHGMKMVEPAAWLRFGVSAAFDQLRNDPKEWMQGAEG